MIGVLQLSTLLIRIFITIYTRFWLHPKRDTETIIIGACKLWITVVDWVTPFSLLYLYKHISARKMVQKKKKVKKSAYNHNADYTMGTERIKMLLEQDENFNDRQLKTLSGAYTEVMVAETNSKHTTPSSPMNTYSKYYNKTPTSPKRELPNET